MAEAQSEDQPTSPADDLDPAVRKVLDEWPPVVYVPTVTGDDGQMHLELKTMKDGRAALLCYSALDRLRDWYGASEGYAALTIEGLAEIREQSRYDVLLLDKRIVPYTDEERAAAGQ